MTDNNKGALNDFELRQEIIRLGPWHHDLEVTPGVRTGEAPPEGSYSEELGIPSVIQPQLSIDNLVEDVFPGGFAGRSFLDCACNAGGYLFAAKAQGAGRCFGFDVREHWINQAKFLSRHLSSEHVQFAVSDIMFLPKLNLESFDITLFNGIFYHLPDPISGLRIAADLTSELLILNTAMLERDDNTLILTNESRTEVMKGVHGLAWLPSGEGVLRSILEWCGFPHIRRRYQSNQGNRTRIELLAARSESTFLHYDAACSLKNKEEKSFFDRIKRFMSV